MRVGVIGAAGRMGQAACEAISGESDLELVAQLERADAVSDVVETKCDVVVDFTVADSARENLIALADAGIDVVVGTTGFAETDLQRFDKAFTKSRCLIVPNFAIGAVLMMRFAEMAAPYFETAEVLELHHELKRDAPSGTALETANRMAAAGDAGNITPEETEVLPGARGAQGPGGIRVHSVRLKGLVAHQEVLLGTTGQSLSIRHDAYDRSAFMPGVLLAVRNISSLPNGITVGLDALL